MMGMTEQNRANDWGTSLKRQTAGSVMLQKIIAKFNDAGACIENDEVRARMNFDTSGISAVAHSPCTWRRMATANPPELNDESVLVPWHVERR